MANNCLACENLKEYAYNFVVNGITEDECGSLRVDQGLNLNLADHNNCEALNDMLDCLIGNLHDRLPSFSLCDWRAYLDEVMTNLYNLQKAMICSECGQWDLLHEHARLIRELQRRIEVIERRLDSIEERLVDHDNRISNTERILSEILRQMRNVGAWSDTGSIPEHIQPNLRGIPSGNINLAAGNINLFGNSVGNRFIRTNQNSNNPQDIRGGVE